MVVSNKGTNRRADKQKRQSMRPQTLQFIDLLPLKPILPVCQGGRALVPSLFSKGWPVVGAGLEAGASVRSRTKCISRTAIDAEKPKKDDIESIMGEMYKKVSLH